MNPNRPPRLPTPAKLIVALPVVLGASQAGAAIVYTDFGPSGVSDGDLAFNPDGTNSVTGSGSFNFSLQVKTDLRCQPVGVGTGVAYSGNTTFFGTGMAIGPETSFTNLALSATSLISFASGDGGLASIAFGRCDTEYQASSSAAATIPHASQKVAPAATPCT